MEPSKKIVDYCSKVCEQVRWNKAHGTIAKELHEHIEDQRADFISEGIDKEEATELAINEMGDAVEVGALLDRVHKPKVQWAMIGLTIFLVIVGYVIRAFTYAQFGFQQSGRTGIGFGLSMPTSVIALIVGIACLVGAYYLDFTFVGKYSRVIYFAAVVIGGGLLIFADSINGRAYVPVTIFSMISLKYLSLLFPIATVALVYSLRGKGYLGIILSWMGIGGLWIILLKVPALYESMQFCVISMMIIMMAVYKNWFKVNRIFGAMLSVAPIMYMATVIGNIIMSREYMMNRLRIHFTPEYLSHSGYEGSIIASTRAIIQHSKMLGSGTLSTEDPALAYIVADQLPDNLITYFIYQVGWLPFVLLITIVCLFVLMGIKIAMGQKSVLGLLVSMTVILNFVLQSVVYVAFNLGFQLVGPLSLPLISPGNTALVINLTLVGLMLSVFRSGHEVKDTEVNRIKIIM